MPIYIRLSTFEAFVVIMFYGVSINHPVNIVTFYLIYDKCGHNHNHKIRKALYFSLILLIRANSSSSSDSGDKVSVMSVV